MKPRNITSNICFSFALYAPFLCITTFRTTCPHEFIIIHYLHLSFHPSHENIALCQIFTSNRHVFHTNDSVILYTLLRLSSRNPSIISWKVSFPIFHNSVSCKSRRVTKGSHMTPLQGLDDFNYWQRKMLIKQNQNLTTKGVQSYQTNSTLQKHVALRFKGDFFISCFLICLFHHGFSAGMAPPKPRCSHFGSHSLEALGRQSNLELQALDQMPSLLSC